MQKYKLAKYLKNRQLFKSEFIKLIFCQFDFLNTIISEILSKKMNKLSNYLSNEYKHLDSKSIKSQNVGMQSSKRIYSIDDKDKARTTLNTQQQKQKAPSFNLVEENEIIKNQYEDLQKFLQREIQRAKTQIKQKKMQVEAKLNKLQNQLNQENQLLSQHKDKLVYMNLQLQNIKKSQIGSEEKGKKIRRKQFQINMKQQRIQWISKKVNQLTTQLERKKKSPWQRYLKEDKQFLYTLLMQRERLAGLMLNLPITKQEKIKYYHRK